MHHTLLSQSFPIVKHSHLFIHHEAKRLIVVIRKICIHIIGDMFYFLDALLETAMEVELQPPSKMIKPDGIPAWDRKLKIRNYSLKHDLKLQTIPY